ncbi:TolC family protein [Neisseria yangbaofengii]|uniref:TolC family protein n=2 Tax=Neisseria yangbaofengii TaxID=2709396 RepID=UPI0018680871|nr:TolC family protein [Neisseria yangbaofengii]
MSKLKRLPLVFVSVSLLSPAVGAFTLKDAWEAALKYSADFSAARNERDADAEKKHQARAQLLPQITANGIYQTQPVIKAE